MARKHKKKSKAGKGRQNAKKSDDARATDDEEVGKNKSAKKKTDDRRPAGKKSAGTKSAGRKSTGQKKKKKTSTATKSAGSESSGQKKESSKDEEAPDLVIEVEDDIDDPEARAELIAAAAGMAVPDAPADGETDDEPTAAGGAAEDGDAEDGGTETTDGGANGGDRDTGAEEAEEGGEAEAPLIGPDALLALSQFRAEGVATVPAELVLELGEATSPDERDRLLAAALAHVEMQDAIYRVPVESGAGRRWKTLIGSLLLVMAIVLVGLPPSFLVPEPPAQLTTGERLRGVRVALLMQAQQIEAFRVREERLPRTLAEVTATLPGIRYVRSNDRLFQLVAYTSDGQVVVYDSAAPDTAFDAVASSWITTRNDS